jgi:hypothetical protein
MAKGEPGIVQVPVPTTRNSICPIHIGKYPLIDRVYYYYDIHTLYILKRKTMEKRNVLT